jgi:hypothetical protein
MTTIIRLLILAFVFQTSLLKAQDSVLFKIVSFRPGVTVDDELAKVGLDVRSPGAQVNIPKGGFVGVINTDGVLSKLTESMTASEISKYVKQSESRKHLGAVTDYFHGDLFIPMAAANQYAKTLSDSIFLFWVHSGPVGIVRHPSTSFTVEFRSMFDEPIESHKVSKNWFVAKYPSYIPDGRRAKRKKFSSQKDRLIYLVTADSPRVSTSWHLVEKAPPDVLNFYQARLAQNCRAER